MFDYNSFNLCNLLIAASYVLIPVELFFVAYHQKNFILQIPIERKATMLLILLLFLFLFFILFCGLSHLFYYLQNILLIKIFLAATTLASASTALILGFSINYILNVFAEIEIIRKTPYNHTDIVENLFIHNSIDLVSLHDTSNNSSFNFLSTNHAFTKYGYVQKDLIGTSLFKIVHVEDQNYLKQTLRSFLTDIGSVHVEFRIYNTLLKSYHHVEASINTIENNKKQILFMICRNIDERKRIFTNELEQRYNDIDLLTKQNYITYLAHDLKTPLNSFGLAIEGLKTDTTIDRKIITLCEQSVESLARILYKIVNCARALRGDIVSPKYEKFLISELIAKVKRTVDPIPKIVPIRYDIPKHIIHLHMCSDIDWCWNILVSYLSNACKFTKTGCIVLKAEILNKDFEMIRFEVIDTGIGIADPDKKKLFMPFSTFGYNNLGLNNGRAGGVALYNVSWQVNSLNGFYGMNDNTPTGSIFWVTLPIEYKKLYITDYNNVEQEFKREANQYNYNILIVDDTSLLLEILKNTFEYFGCVVTTADDGEPAIQLVKQNAYDLILLDLEMINIGGLEAITQIRKWEIENKKLRNVIIAITASSIGVEPAICKQNGFSGFVNKPVNQKKILTILKNLSEISYNSFRIF